MASIGGGEIKRYEFTRAWGINPSSARGEVVIDDPESFTLEEGDYVVYQFGALATFFGIVSQLEAVEAEGAGTMVSFTVLDNRIRLQWAVVTGAWNMPDSRANPSAARPTVDPADIGTDTAAAPASNDVNFGGATVELSPSDGVGALVEPTNPELETRRYRHMPPEQAAAGIWLETTEPLTARQILNSAFNGAWGAYTFDRDYHADMSTVYPLGIDATDGVKLSGLIAQINEACGLDVRLDGARDLVWDRKGEGLLPVIPTTNASPRRLGRSLTANDTAVMVVGDPNVVQVVNVSLEPDWQAAWEEFIDEAAWVREVAEVFTLPTATRANRAELAARAREVTVGEYVVAKEDASFADHRPFGKTNRMGIPAWTYIRELVYRSYRIPRTYTWGGIPLSSLRIAPKLLIGTEVTGTGAAAKQRYRREYKAFYPESRVEVIAQGQPLDMIDGRSIHLFMTRRTRLLRQEWTQMNDFEVDEEAHAIRFRSPVFIDGDPANDEAIYSRINAGQGGGPDVSAEVESESDYLEIVVPNPGYVITPANVKIALAWELGKYRSTYGTGPRYGTLKVPGLAMHMIDTTTDSGYAEAGTLAAVAENPAFLPDNTGLSLKEMKFANGDQAADAAADAADSLIQLSAVEDHGGYTLIGASGTTLTNTIDRVTLTIDEGGVREVVDLTKARPTSAFVAERTTQRIQRISELFPGQDALRRDIESLRLEAKLQRSETSDRRSTTHETVDDIARKPIGAEVQSTATYIDENSAAPSGGWEAGDLVWLDGKGLPSTSGTVFGGVLVRDPASGSGKEVLTCATAGTVPVRCKAGVTGAVAAVPGQRSASLEGTYPIGALMHAEPVPDAGSTEARAMVKIGARSDVGDQFQIVGVTYDAQAEEYTCRITPGWVIGRNPAGDDSGGTPPDALIRVRPNIGGVPMDDSTVSELTFTADDAIYCRVQTNDKDQFKDDGGDPAVTLVQIVVAPKDQESIHYQPKNPGDENGVDGDYYYEIATFEVEDAQAPEKLTIRQIQGDGPIFHGPNLWEGSNLGSGAESFKQRNTPADLYEFRSIRGNFGIQETQEDEEIVLDFWGENVGAGCPVWVDPNGQGQPGIADGASQFRSLKERDSQPQIQVKCEAASGTDPLPSVITIQGNDNDATINFLDCDGDPAFTMTFIDGLLASAGGDVQLGNCSTRSTGTGAPP